MLTGENGLLTKANEAQEASRKAYYQDEIELIISEKQIEKSTNIREEREFIVIVAEAIKEKDWVKENGVTICDEYGNDIPEKEKCSKIIVNTKDGYEIIVNIDNDKVEGEVVSIAKRKEEYKVSFKANGGEGTEPEEKTVQKGFAIKLPEGENLVKTGYTLVGWSEEEDAEKQKERPIYAPNSKYEPSKKETILYAVWTQKPIEVSFNSNTGEGQMKNMIAEYQQSITLPINEFSKTGYKFKGWSKTPNETETIYQEGATIEFTEDTTLYAIWAEDMTATLSVTKNKLEKGTIINIVGNATTGVDVVTLKLGNDVLYSVAYRSNGTFNSNLELSELNQNVLANLMVGRYYTLTLVITSRGGATITKTQVVSNFTIGSENALIKFLEDCFSQNIRWASIYQLCDITITRTYTPDSDGFFGTYDGNGKTVNMKVSPTPVSERVGMFSKLGKATVRNLKVTGSIGDGSSNFTGAIARRIR